MWFRVLGPLEVVFEEDADRAVAGDVPGLSPAGAKERAILARLLLEPGRAVATEALLEAGWPGAPPEAASRSLQVRLAHLRAFLEPRRPPRTPSTLLVRDGAGYRLAIDPGAVDAARFERFVRAGDHDAALALWRGAPFAEVAFADFAQAEIRRLEELRAQAREGRARALVERGREDEALPELTRLVEQEPLREELVGLLARALYRAGRQVEALDALRALGARLSDLGLEPAAATRELERRILVHDPELAPPPAAVPPAAASDSATSASSPTPEPARRPPLPVRASRFFGREAHLAHAAGLVGEGVLVTIAGVGGAGKTRLALELVQRAAATAPDGPWWCELAPVAGDADVVGAVASAAGIEPARLDRLVEHLAPRAGLLVLDNCEHVLEGAAAVAEQLLARCPRLAIVATSRAPLGVDGERLLRLSGLELPAGHAPDAAASPAVALFLDRAAAVGGLAPDPAPSTHAAPDLDAIGDLCRRLDGLPLAIELAAGRTRSMTPAEIAERLSERLAVLAVPGRRATPRHSTLRAAVDWSYDLLDEPRRRLFERLSVFARGCTLAAAEEVCAGDGVERAAVADLLDELVAHSLVTAAPAGGRTRYVLLATLRQYGAERLRERGETTALRDRHADHYVARGRRMAAQGWRERKLPFVDEFDDLRAAVRWCLRQDAGPERAFTLVGALWWPAPARHGEEIARLAEEVVARWPDPHPLLPTALGTASVARLVIGDGRLAREHAEAAVALEERLGEPALLGRRTLAQLAFFGAAPDAALATWRELAALARAAGLPALACEADGFAVQLLFAAGDQEAARELAAAMRAQAQRLSSAFLTSWARYVSGIVELESDPDAARGWLEETLALARQTDHHHMTRFTLRALGLAAAAQGDDAAAARNLLAALEHDEATSDAASQWTTLLAIAVLLAERHGGDAPLPPADADAAAILLEAASAWPAAPYLTARAARARAALAVRGEPSADTATAARALDLGAAKSLARAALAARVAPRAPA